MVYTTAELVEKELRLTVPFDNVSTIPSLDTVNEWIAEESAYIDRLAGRTFEQVQYTVTLDYNGCDDRIQLKNAPLISVDQFRYAQDRLGTDTYPNFTTLTEDTQFTSYDDGTIEFLFNRFTPKEGLKRFEITYTAGYATTPLEVQKLATKLVAYRVIDSLLMNKMQDTTTGAGGCSVSIGAVRVMSPSDFGINNYRQLASDIEKLEESIVGGMVVFRYDSY